MQLIDYKEYKVILWENKLPLSYKNIDKPRATEIINKKIMLKN